MLLSGAEADPWTAFTSLFATSKSTPRAYPSAFTNSRKPPRCVIFLILPPMVNGDHGQFEITQIRLMLSGYIDVFHSGLVRVDLGLWFWS